VEVRATGVRQLVRERMGPLVVSTHGAKPREGCVDPVDRIDQE
jgi:hypothetical protein